MTRTFTSIWVCEKSHNPFWEILQETQNLAMFWYKNENIVPKGEKLDSTKIYERFGTQLIYIFKIGKSTCTQYNLERTAKWNGWNSVQKNAKLFNSFYLQNTAITLKKIVVPLFINIFMP